MKRILGYCNASYANRVEKMNALSPGWALKGERPDKQAFAEAHQNWMEDMMAFWPRISAFLGEAIERQDKGE
jgi:hypothetical protein